VVAHDEDNRDEIAYWRKHPNLQGWMEQLWREKGGKGEFNCVDVELTREDLKQLELAKISSLLAMLGLQWTRVTKLSILHGGNSQITHADSPCQVYCDMP